MSKIEDVLKDRNTKSLPSLFILARLWRAVLRETNMDVARFNTLLAQHAVEPGTRKQETDARARLRKALASPNLSVTAFVNGMRMLKAIRITFALKVEFQDQPSVTVSESIQFHHPLHNPIPSQTKEQ